jgi:UMP-CMP kinase
VSGYGFVHLSAGDLLRAEQETKSSTAELIRSYIKDGKIVPVAITVGLLKQAMIDNMKLGHNNFLIDGFPRNKDNLDGWNAVMAGFANVRFCLYFDCPEAVMEARLLERGKTSGRADDNIASIKKRYLFASTDSSSIPCCIDCVCVMYL